MKCVLLDHRQKQIIAAESKHWNLAQWPAKEEAHFIIDNNDNDIRDDEERDQELSQSKELWIVSIVKRYTLCRNSLSNLTSSGLLTLQRFMREDGASLQIKLTLDGMLE